MFRARDIAENQENNKTVLLNIATDGGSWPHGSYYSIDAELTTGASVAGTVPLNLVVGTHSVYYTAADNIVVNISAAIDSSSRFFPLPLARYAENFG